MKTTKIQGLTSNQVLESRRKYGVNVLTPPKKQSLFLCFLEKFKDPLIVILCIAGFLSLSLALFEIFLLNESSRVIVEPIGIFFAIILSTGLAFFFEAKANKEFSLLNQVSDDEKVVVLRNGKQQQIAKKDVVVGDIVFLNIGDEIPADGQLLKASDLKIDESSLTGELICNKTTKSELFSPHATYPSDYVLRGTKVMEGHGIFRVEKVGDATENGKVYEDVQMDTSIKTPLNEQLEQLSRWITYVSYVLALLIVIGRCFMYLHTPEGWIGISGAEEWTKFAIYCLQSIMLAVTLIVVAVPEGLPMAVTLSLAYSMRAMLKTNNLVRKMHACETMGAVTVICTDKTGTLTQNKMQVVDSVFEQDVDDIYIYESIALNSTAVLSDDTVIGNPTEGALLYWLKQQDVDYQNIREQAEIIEEVPFSSERKYMATLVRTQDGRRVVYLKGAPEIIQGFCQLSDLQKMQIDSAIENYQNRAMRTLAFAYKCLDKDEVFDKKTFLQTTHFQYVGLVAISDPVREDVPQSVQDCIKAGIRIIIVTGDSPKTAIEIGRNIGIWTKDDNEHNIIEGSDFASLSDDELYKCLPSLKIVARARPSDKKRLVEALQHMGEVVAVTGDGTNDAPAIKAAHVGLSMGAGTSVAKEASDITIIDNSFASIGRAVMWGRSLYRNIQRFIIFQMTVNVAACLVVLAGAFMGKDSPLTVTQMLWVNLIMDSFAAMALASLPPTKEVMSEKPRDRKAHIVNRRMMKQIIGVGGVICILMIGLTWLFEHINITQSSSLIELWNITKSSTLNYDGLSAYELSLFFSIFVFIQFWNLFNAKAYNSGGLALVRPKEWSLHRKFFAICLIIIIGQILIVNFGGDFFSVTPLALEDWLQIILFTLPVALIGEISRGIKMFKNKTKVE